MATRGKPDEHPDFTFVNVDAESANKPRRTKHARAHTARVIRRRLRDQADAETTQASDSRQAPKDVILSSSVVRSTPSTLNFSASTSMTAGSIGRSSGSRIEQSAEVRRDRDFVERLQTQPRSSPRAVSPTMGALEVQTFDVGTSTAAIEVANYLLKVDWPNLLTPTEREAWFQTFCKQPVIFHAFSHASATHQDILRNRVSRSARRDMLAHKTETFRLLGELVANLDSDGDSLELLIFAIMIMWHYDLKDEEIGETDVLPFSPHMPGANWLSVYGRTQGVEAHARPMMALVQRAGGIEQLKLPGLAFAIACGELVGCSIQSGKPSLPLYWTSVPSPDEMFNLLHLKPPLSFGRGFQIHILGGLPSETTTALTGLCVVNVLMGEARIRRLSEAQERMLVDARNAAQYRLLSLPSWNELDPETQRGRSSFAYECCRITALLYSNAVIFPLPLNTGWHKKLVLRLRTLMEASDVNTAPISMSPLLIWSIFVAGIAAYRSTDRTWFIRQLRGVLRQAQLFRWRDVERLLDDFLWSKEACKIGAAMLWDELAMDQQMWAGSTVIVPPR